MRLCHFLCRQNTDNTRQERNMQEENMVQKRLEVKQDEKKVYDIVIKDTFQGLTEELEAFDIEKKRLCIVTERNVSSYYLNEIHELLNEACRQVDIYFSGRGSQQKSGYGQPALPLSDSA